MFDIMSSYICNIWEIFLSYTHSLSLILHVYGWTIRVRTVGTHITGTIHDNYLIKNDYKQHEDKPSSLNRCDMV